LSALLLKRASMSRPSGEWRTMVRPPRDAAGHETFARAALPATGTGPAITHLKFRDGRNVIFDAAITMAFGSIAGGYACVSST
jgi:hypothetical protein